MEYTFKIKKSDIYKGFYQDYATARENDTIMASLGRKTLSIVKTTPILKQLYYFGSGILKFLHIIKDVKDIVTDPTTVVNVAANGSKAK